MLNTAIGTLSGALVAVIAVGGICTAIGCALAVRGRLMGRREFERMREAMRCGESRTTRT